MSRNIEKLKRISLQMKNVCTVIMVGIPISHILIWANFEKAQYWGFYHRTPYMDGYLFTSNLLAGFLVSGILAVIAIMAIREVRKFFIQCSEGEIFITKSAMALSQFAKLLVLYSCLSIPAESALSVAMSFNNPVGERLLSVSFQTYDFTIIFLSFVFFAISWVVKESVLIAEENAQII